MKGFRLTTPSGVTLHFRVMAAGWVGCAHKVQRVAYRDEGMTIGIGGVARPLRMCAECLVAYRSTPPLADTVVV